MIKILTALTLSLVLIAGTTSFAFAQTSHDPNAVTDGSLGTPSTLLDTTATINYCVGGAPFDCHIDFQDSDGVGSTFSSTLTGFGSVNGNLDFASCPVGTPGVFNGAWTHAEVGATITSTDCNGNTLTWNLISETEIVLVVPVGGEFLSIDSTSLVLAGLQSSAIWMLPALAGIAGVGAYYIRTRMSKE